MKFKEYEMPDGKKAVFEYDENGVGKITLECMDMLMGLINDRKTENCSEKPNEPSNSEKPNNSTISKMEQVDKDINVRSKDEPHCYTCKYERRGCADEPCVDCRGRSKYEPKDEPQDEYAKEYEELGLRKLKELRKDEPQTDCPWK